MDREKQLVEFVERFRHAGGTNLKSVVLFGSAASGDFQPQLSDLNLLCVFADLSVPSLQGLASATAWWRRLKQPAPLLFTQSELKAAADVFVIEFLDMQESHRVLFGEDVVSALRIRRHLHHRELEHELRAKLLLLRARFLESQDKDSRLIDLLLESLPSFLTLFRHALMVAGEPAPNSRREILQSAASSFKFESATLLQLLDLRERKLDRGKVNANAAFADYFRAVDAVIKRMDAGNADVSPRQRP